MPLATVCPSCATRWQLPDEAEGRRVKCSQCGASFTAHGTGPSDPYALYDPPAAPLTADEAPPREDVTANPSAAQRGRSRRQNRKNGKRRSYILVGALNGAIWGGAAASATYLIQGPPQPPRNEQERAQALGRSCGQFAMIPIGVVVGILVFKMRAEGRVR